MLKKIRLITILYCFLAFSQALFAFGKIHLGDLYYLLDEHALTAEVTASIDQHGMAGNYPELDSVVIPDTVTYLRVKYAVKSIGEYAFDHSDLTTIVIPDHIQSIGESAFGSCKNLTSVTLPEGTDKLFRVFSGCTSLCRITIPKSVVSVNALFGNCTNLDSVVLPPNITLLGSTFANCISLQNVTLPDSLQIIRRLTFLNCQSLQSITLPEKVTEVNTQAFKDCLALDTIRVLAAEPPTATSESFTGMDKSSCILLVPASSIDLYREAECWKDFNVQPLDSPTGIGASTILPKSGKILHNGQIYIVRGDNTYTLQGQELK